jgi:hypothetical protein
MATRTVKMIPPVGFEPPPRTSLVARSKRLKSHAQGESVRSCVPRKPTADFLLLGPPSELLAFWPNRRGSTLVLESSGRRQPAGCVAGGRNGAAVTNQSRQPRRQSRVW